MDFMYYLERRVFKWWTFHQIFVTLVCLIVSSTSLQDDNCPKSCLCSKMKVEVEVDCRQANLSILPKNLPNNTQILLLDENRFTSFPNISKLKNLRKISLSNNLIANINVNWKLIAPNLEILNMSRNYIQSIAPMDGMENLRSLDLSRNKIENISGLSSTFPLLRFLYIHHNKISDINVIRRNKMPNLYLLHAGYNQIGSLISTVDKEEAFPNLRILELSHNNISIIDMYLMRFKALTKLVLSYNKLEKIIPASFLGNYDLKELYLDHNRLKRITNGWLTFKQKLTYLSLAHNSIAYIDSHVFKSSPNILSLDLSHNKLLSLKEDSFLFLGNLTTLYLQHNGMEFVSEHAFNGLASLQVLNMSNNQISLGRREFDSCFKPLSRLKVLDLQKNYVLMIPSTAFIGLFSLIALDLRHNDIEIIENGAFSSLRNIKDIHLIADKMTCTCSAKYLRDWILQNGFQSQVQGRCSSPQWLSGKTVLELLDSELVCEKDHIGMSQSFRPKVVQHPISKNAFREGGANFTCAATASVSDPMYIYWYHGNIQVRQEFVMTSKQEPVSSRVYRLQSFLRLKRVQFEEAGDYWCYVTNIYGSDWSVSANLTVVVRPQLSLRLKEEITKRSGKDIIIPCSATGIPPPKVQFAKIDGTKPFPAVRDKRLDFTQREITIHRLTIEDTGVYSCMAISAVGIANATIKLTVIEEPKFQTGMLAQQKVTIGKTAILDCQVSGFPIPKVTWYKNDKQLYPSERLKLSSVLAMEDVEYSDEGKYECVAQNRLGTARQSTHLGVLSEDGENITERGSSKLPTEVFISVVLLTIIAVVVLTSLVWATLLCRLRKKRREKLERKQDELMSRYVEESLLCSELPKNYTLRYHGQLVKVPKRPSQHEGEDSMHLFTEVENKHEADEPFVWTPRENGIPNHLEHATPGNTVPVVYPTNNINAIMSHAPQNISTHHGNPQKHVHVVQHPHQTCAHNRNFDSSTMKVASQKKRVDGKFRFNDISEGRRKNLPCKGCSNNMQAKPSKPYSLQSNPLDIVPHTPINIVHNRPPDTPHGMCLLPHKSEKQTKSLNSISTYNSKHIDFDPTRLKRVVNALHRSANSVTDIDGDLTLNYITSSSGVDSGNSSESLNNNEFIELQTSLT